MEGVREAGRRCRHNLGRDLNLLFEVHFVGSKNSFCVCRHLMCMAVRVCRRTS
jgi:hypothetical protein